MRPYVAVLVSWAAAAYCFYNSYYGIRFPEKYIRANWTMMRGLRKKRDSASAGAALSMVIGALFFGGGLFVVHALMTRSNAPLPPLP